MTRSPTPLSNASYTRGFIEVIFGSRISYEVLSNSDERAAYDRYGPSDSRQPRVDMDDLFSSMFGGGFGATFDDYDEDTFGASFSFDPAGPSRRPRGPRHTEVGYDITLEEAFRGKRVVMNLQRDRVCGVCKG